MGEGPGTGLQSSTISHPFHRGVKRSGGEFTFVSRKRSKDLFFQEWSSAGTARSVSPQPPITPDLYAAYDLLSTGLRPPDNTFLAAS